ncbi:MAG: ABC transporter permease [Bacteroidales bacterium]|nr:ABC transporter permease [Bacteroidales bacterium]MDY4512891.1 ABC transporter permease [Paludibacteraceae bacterium]MCI7429998.1 ABC transporter permease [Bacteroidales bacterium]MDD6641984.1 ABC transporter permease [Bacteroidales bacterium]MDD6781370.1 ABC transporter permease [Bacteroidales bacterium]
METWTTDIKPKNRLFDVDFKELWHYRDLCALFVKRNVITQYKQTILGPLWYLVQPLMTTVMYMVVFGGIAKIPTDGLPQPLFYLAGICMWQYFSDCLSKTSNTFVDNAGIFGKVYFPRLVVPLSNVMSNLVRFGIQLGLFFAVYLYYQLFTPVQIHTNWYALLLPFLVLLLAGLALGFGILFSSMTTKYRDLQLLLSFFVSLWMYATPVIYPLSTITNEKLRFVMSLNPLTGIIEAFKYGILGVGQFSWSMLAYSFGFMLLLLALGIVVFNKVQRSFMDTV